MQVNGIDYRTVWMEGNSVFFIEQNLLPFEFRIHEAKTFEESCRAIRTMMVRGAGAIGALAGYAMAQAALEAVSGDYMDAVGRARKVLEATRPTARNLFHAAEIVAHAATGGAKAAVEAAEEVADRDAEDSRKIGELGSSLIRDGMRISTHCNAGWLAFVDHGTALSPIYLSHKQGKSLFVYVDETRPRSQGARLTAWELANEGIDHSIVPDNAGAYLMSKGMVDLVITGADRIAANGDTANKIGTFEKAIVARQFGIPFFVAAPLSTFDISTPTGEGIEIEERSADEVNYQTGPDKEGQLHTIRVTNPGSDAFNPAFDVTPADFITGIITEKGIIKPDNNAIATLLR